MSTEESSKKAFKQLNKKGLEFYIINRDEILEIFEQSKKDINNITLFHNLSDSAVPFEYIKKVTEHLSKRDIEYLWSGKSLEETALEYFPNK